MQGPGRAAVHRCSSPGLPALPFGQVERGAQEGRMAQWPRLHLPRSTPLEAPAAAWTARPKPQGSATGQAHTSPRTYTYVGLGLL